MTNFFKNKQRRALVVVTAVASLCFLGAYLSFDYFPQKQAGTASVFQLPLSPGLLDSFGVLAASSIASSGDTVINGDLGISPSTTITGFLGTLMNDGPGIVHGIIHEDDATAMSIQNELNTLYQTLALALPITENIGAAYLDGRTLGPGIYDSSSTLRMGTGGTLILDGEGDPESTFILRAEKAINIADGASIVLQNGASACHVFWNGKSGFAIGDNVNFSGTVVSNGNIWIGGGALITGRLLARNSPHAGMVTFTNTGGNSAVVTVPVCPTTPPPPGQGNITVVKNVVGGTKAPGDFMMRIVTASLVMQGLQFQFPGDSHGTATSLNDGTQYTVTEGPVIDYVETTAGDCQGIIRAGDNKVCTITNTYKTLVPPPPSGTEIHLRSRVVNNYAGTAVDSDWTLTASGDSITAGYLSGTSPVDSDSTFPPGTYELQENDGPNGYRSDGWSCGPAVMPDATHVVVAAGDSVTCTLVHHDVEKINTSNYATIKVIKHVVGGTADASNFTMTVANHSGFASPDPFPGSETGTTVPIRMNTGFSVAEFEVTESGPSGYRAAFSPECSGVVKANDSLECVITNTYESPVVHHGSSPIVGVILEKVASTTHLSRGGGLVTYNYFGTNTGTRDIKNVQVVDDKCSPVVFISGDTDGDEQLDLDELWQYQCSATITRDTENTAVITGISNNRDVSDSATAMVTVQGDIPTGTPKLPKTGLGPKEFSLGWMIGFTSLIAGIIAWFQIKAEKK